MQFNYRGRDKEGNLKTGTIEASSKGAAILKLQDMELYVTSLQEENVPFYKSKINLPQKISQIEIVVFSRQLAIMLQSKITVVESLKIISKQITNESFREKIEEITDNVEGGVPLSRAFRKHSDVFSPFYVSMMESGEASGKLAESLDYLATQLEKNYEFRKKMIGAVTYPAFIIVVFSAVLTFLFLFVVPELVEMLEDFDAEIPFLTRVVISVSSFLQSWWWMVVLGLFFLVSAFLRFIKTRDGKELFDTYILKIPILGFLFKKIYLSYFAESMAILMESGLSIVKALDITEKVVGNAIYQDIVREIKKEVKGGKDISFVLERYPDYFPGLFIQMVVAGERSGEMSFSLKNAAKFYKEDVERSLESYVKLTEPILIILLGGLVGSLVLSILLPIYNIGLAM